MLRTIFLTVTGVAVIALAAAFAWLNPGNVTLDLGVGVYEVPVAYAIIGTLALGWLFGLLAAALWVMKSARQRRQIARQLRLAEAEVTNLRRMPDGDAG